MNKLKLLAIAASLGFAFSMPAAAQTSGAKSDAATPKQSQSSGTSSASAGQTAAPTQSASSGQTSSVDRAPVREDRTNWGWLGLLGLLGLSGLLRKRDEPHRYDATGTTRKTAV